MPYATRQDIANEIRSIASFPAPATGKEMDEDKVDQFLIEADAEINSKLQNRYVIPLVNATTEAGELLKKIEIDFVVYRIAKILNLKKDIPIGGDITGKTIIQKITEGDTFKLAIKRLDDLNTGRIIIAGADQLSTQQGNRSVVVDCDVQSVILKDKTQW